MAATADPFYSLRAEVEANLKDITSNSGGMSARNVEDALQRIHWDLEMLEESIDRVTANPAKFGITTDEVDRRHQFVASVKQQMSSIRSATSSRGGGSGGGGHAAQRESLLGGKNQSKAAKKAAADLESANDSFMDQENLRQSLLHREQDEYLDDLGQSLTRLGGMGKSISEELMEQEKIIDDLQQATDYTVHNMNDVNRLVSDMLKSKQGRSQLCLILLLVVAIMVVIFLIFVL